MNITERQEQEIIIEYMIKKMLVLGVALWTIYTFIIQIMIIEQDLHYVEYVMDLFIKE